MNILWRWLNLFFIFLYRGFHRKYWISLLSSVSQILYLIVDFKIWTAVILSTTFIPPKIRFIVLRRFSTKHHYTTFTNTHTHIYIYLLYSITHIAVLHASCKFYLRLKTTTVQRHLRESFQKKKKGKRKKVNLLCGCGYRLSPSNFNYGGYTDRVNTCIRTWLVCRYH